MARLALVRRLLPSHPFLGLSKAGYPVSLCCLGASDPADVAKQLTADDLVRVSRRCPAAAARVLNPPPRLQTL